jgi:inward rectifier potassium channel
VSWRFLNRDGTYNIARSRGKSFPLSDLYHSLLSASWTEFLSVIIGVYLAINLLFAGAYFLSGPEALEGVRRDTFFHHFSDCFFFSVQTLATIGYGRISPMGLGANLLVTIEAFIGLLSLALVTGLFYARFARPTARILFSDVAIIGPHDGAPALVFRLANERLNQIVEAHVTVNLIKDETTAEGEDFRNFYELSLDRDRSPVFNMSWTVVHWIDDRSPLKGLKDKDLREVDAEIAVTLSGLDATMAAPIHARFSYVADDIVWNKRFRDILTSGDDGKIHVDLSHMHETV